MDTFTFIRLVKEAGIPIGAFVLCAWMVIYIVKRLAASIDNLATNFAVFMSHVRHEHENADKQHVAIMDRHKDLALEHKEMILTLGRINGYTKEEK